MPKPSKSADIGQQPGEISAGEASKRLGMTAQAIGQWCSRPGAPARRIGQRVWVRWPDFARWREQELVRQARADAAPVSLDDARARKANAEAELAELDVAKARGEWVSVADYERALGRILDIEVARLRALPVRLAYLGQAVEAAAEAEIERVIVEMSAFDEDVADEPAAAERAA